MTHSLHRRGSVNSLKDDYVFITRTVAGLNRTGCGPKLKTIRNILCDVGISNTGRMETGENMAHGLTEEMLRADETESPIIAASVPSRARIKEIVRRVKEADLGLSVTVSGLIDEVLDMCRELDLQPHTVNLSLGVHGKTELLPSEDCLELTTMCGHALIASHLADQMQADVTAGRTDSQAAARQLARPCICGIFNLTRAEVLLQGGDDQPTEIA
ncbi:MAG: hypothetical protein M1570_07720 [Chloroflexi bacterium]|nr:hypothetical protein [Chloroflexota bacterium]